MHLRTPIVAALLYALAGLPGAALAGKSGPLEEAAEAATAALAEVGFVARVDIGNLGRFYVHPDGRPLDEREQNQGGYKGSTIWAPGGSTLVRAGEEGHVMFVKTKYPGKRARDNEFWVFFNKKRHVNAAGVAVVFDRPVRPDDITPEKIATAVAAVATIHGYEPGTRVAAAFDEALAAAPPPAATAPAGGPAPALVTLRAWTEPDRVALGGEVRLRLEYELSAGSHRVLERVTLLHGDQVLPGYPSESSLERPAGVHQASYAQVIPSSAAGGTYTMRAEVCVAGDCIARTATFEATP